LVERGNGEAIQQKIEELFWNGYSYMKDSTQLISWIEKAVGEGNHWACYLKA